MSLGGQQGMDEAEALLLLPCDQIPYARLDEAVLTRLAAQTADPFITTLALGELAQRQPQRAGMIAWELLQDPAADTWLRQQAIGILYETARARAIAWIEAEAETPDQRLLEAMFCCIDFETAAASPALTRLARRLARRAQALPPEGFDWREGVADFIAHFLAGPAV